MDSKIKIIWSCAFLILSFTSNGQMKIDLGSDTTYCLRLFPQDTCYIGTNLKIENGQPPYTFAWDCKVVLTEHLAFTASDFLNDTTIPTPFFIDTYPFNTWMKFILHVSDSLDSYAKDSINVRFSSFGYSVIYFDISLIKGDSIQFNGIKYIAGGIPPLTFKWQPTNGLSDPKSLFTWCKPDSSVDYYQVATDSLGCISNPNLVYSIEVMSTGLNDKYLENTDYLINPIQIESKVFFNNPSCKRASITLYELNGLEVLNLETFRNNIEMGHLLQKRGIYILKVSIDNKIGTGKFIKY